MKKKFKKIVSVLLSLTLLMPYCPNSTAKAAAKNTVNITVQYGQTEARTILDMINELRTGADAWYWNPDNSTKTTCANLQKLTYDYELEKVAMLRAAEIAVSYSHTRPNGSGCFTAYTENNYSYMTCGENIAAGYPSASQVNSGWREDNENYSGQGHRRNMLNKSFKAVGIGHVKFNGCDYWVEEFSGNTPKKADTKANDQKQECTISINPNYISDCLVYNIDENISLDCGESYDASNIYVMLGYKDYFNNYRKNTFPINEKPVISSNDPNIAVYSNGKITGISEGETTLTVTILGVPSTVNVSVSGSGVTPTVSPSPTVTPKPTAKPTPTVKPSDTPDTTVKPSETPDTTVEPSETPDTPDVTATPVPEITPSAAPTATPDPGDNKDNSITKNGIDYTITSKTAISITNSDKSKKTITIPDYVQIDGTKYKVTSIKANAFKNCTKMTKVVIGKNIKSIGKNAFKGCKALKQINIKSTVVNQNNVKTTLLSQITKKTTVTVPKSKYNSYKNIVKKLKKQKKYIILKKQ